MTLPTSTSTVLDTVTTVLRNCGEKSVESFNTPISRRALSAVQRAFDTIRVVHPWEFYKMRVPASSWDNNVATISNMDTLIDVFVGSDSEGWVTIPRVSERVLYRSPLVAYDSSTVPKGVPSMYTVRGHNEVHLNPYPTDSGTRQRVSFHILYKPSIPQVETDTFELPETLITLVTHYATSLMFIEQYQNYEAAKHFMSLYEMEVHHRRTRYGPRYSNISRSGISRW